MKAFVRFGCGDILEAEAKEVGGGVYRFKGPDGPLYVDYAMVFRSREEAENNKHTPTLSNYQQVFRKPVKLGSFYEWNTDNMSRSLLKKVEIDLGELDEFLSVLEPTKGYP